MPAFACAPAPGARRQLPALAVYLLLPPRRFSAHCEPRRPVERSSQPLASSLPCGGFSHHLPAPLACAPAWARHQLQLSARQLAAFTAGWRASAAGAAPACPEAAAPPPPWSTAAVATFAWCAPLAACFQLTSSQRWVGRSLCQPHRTRPRQPGPVAAFAASVPACFSLHPPLLSARRPLSAPASHSLAARRQLPPPAALPASQPPPPAAAAAAAAHLRRHLYQVLLGGIPGCAACVCPGGFLGRCKSPTAVRSPDPGA